MKRQSVLFLIDTQGANQVGACAGNVALQTPNIDRLAANGVRFDRAYTCSPVCGPARSAIFTGLYPHSNGVLGNNQAPHADLPTLGQRISRAGIRAGYIGKWHLDGTDYFGDGRCPAGWDPAWWFDGRNYLDSLPDRAARDLSRQVLDPRSIAEHHITAEFTHAHRTASRAVKFIEQHRDEDFLLVVSIDEPHGPSICPEPFVSRFEEFEFEIPNARDPLTGKPRVQQEWAAFANGRGARVVERDGRCFVRDPRFFSCNSYSDHEVGRVLNAIAATTPDALVIYTSDHGNALHNHQITGKGPAMYEEITRIPFIVRWPGNSPAGTVSQGPVSHIDLVPTFLDFFDIAQPDLLQGHSLRAQIADPSHGLNEHVFIEFNRYEVDHDSFGGFCPIRCVHNGRHKLAINLLDRDEFYDLATDPHELTNRIDEPSATRDQLHDVLISWMHMTRDPLRGGDWARRPWRDVAQPTWGGPTRPRPFDEAFHPRTMLYGTGREAHTYTYMKG
jgi:uncharacterized sulfatase